MKNPFAVAITLFFLPIVALGENFIGKSAFAPEVNININISENYSINSKIESFHYFYDIDQENGNWNRYYDGTDIQIFLTRRMGPFQRIAAGYQLSLEPGGDFSHRLIQQITLRTRATAFTPGHRIRLDQTFSENNPVRLRLRYRYSAEIPLQGQVLDPGEFFLLTSGEAILSTQKNIQDLETRLVFQAGYLIKPGQRIQWGTDFRSRASEDFSNNNLLIKLGLAITL